MPDLEEVKEGLSPEIIAGLTNDPDEDREQYERSKVADGESVVRDIAEVQYLPGTRIPLPRFIATNDDDTAWMDGVHNDRLMRGAIVSYPPEVVDAMRQGYICIRCQEVSDDSFPLACSLCGYPMRERQAVDFAAEFEGDTNMGPSLALSLIEQERQVAAEKARFDRKILEGGSPMKGLRRG